MIKLIGKLIINHVKKISARNQYFTNTIYSCVYSALNNKYDNIGANIMCFQHRLFLYWRCF